MTKAKPGPKGTKTQKPLPTANSGDLQKINPGAGTKKGK